MLDNDTERSTINYDRFKELPDSDFAYRKFERVFSGRMTKRRWQIISSFCRKHSYRPRVYSDYDCTGALCGHYMEFTYTRNQVSVQLAMSYDY
jgi:hypothetical protein